MVIDPQAVQIAFITALAGLITALGFYVRERAKTRSYVERQRSDGARLQEESRVNRDNTLAEIAKQGLATQQKMIEAVEKNTRAYEDLSRTSTQNAAETRGMFIMLDNHTRAVRTATIAMDEMAEKFPAITTELHDIREVTTTLQTDIEGSISEQFKPIVAALEGIGTSITILVAAMQSKDVALDSQLAAIVSEFRSTHRELMTKLEPIVLKHLGELINEPVPSE